MIKVFTILYYKYTSLQESYYRKDKGKLILSLTSFKYQAPIVVIDTSEQNDTGTRFTVDVGIKIETLESLDV